MFFSFIIPTYNGQLRLKKCIDSVLQLEKLCDYEFEIILIDDGSKDLSSIFADSMALATNRIVSIHQKNKGVSAARNIGIKASCGDYIVFIDSDDTIVAEKLIECMRIVIENDSVDIVFYGISFDYFQSDKKYRSEILLPPYQGEQPIEACLEKINTLFDRNCLSPLWNKIIRKRILSYDLLREDMFLYEDLEFSLRLLSICKNIFFFQDVVYNYYQADHCSSRIRRVNDIEEIVEKISLALNALDCDKSYILDKLRDILYQEKIDSMSYSELKQIFPKEYIRQLITRPYRKVRHRIANWIKLYIGDFRKW